MTSRARCDTTASGSLSRWRLVTLLRCLSCSSRRLAEEVGGPGRTGERWCEWLQHAALSAEIGRQLDGTVAAKAR